MLAQKQSWQWLGWWLAPVATVLLTDWAGAAEQERKTPPEAPAQAADNQAESGAGYWLGILGAPADALVKTHLKLDAGVVVEHVVPESPAAKAGIRENDILLQMGDVTLTDVESLMKAVTANKEREAKLSLLREGKETTLTVKPAPRPAGIAMPAVPGVGDWGRITDWMLKRLERGEADEDPLHMFFVHPGVVVPKELRGRRFEWSTAPSATVPLPKNTRVTITRQQDEPAKIIVQQGEQKWEVTEKELDKLPADVRPAIQSMLGGNTRVYYFGRGPVVMPGVRPQGTGKEPAAKAGAEKSRESLESAEPAVEAVRQKLEEINRQLRENEKRMQRQLDEMRQQLERVNQQL
ncbi:MAG: PDZ domain-containing protein [Candidatus Anammoximicrobium sp.]|nr:PDZ domain-containing protein [Candidatus Anammoximicrobium sp.]